MNNPKKGVSLLRFQPARNCISLISRSRRAGEVAAVGLMIDGPHVGMLSTDMEKNLFVSVYRPDTKESNGGKHLIRKTFKYGLGTDGIFWNVVINQSFDNKRREQAVTVESRKVIKT